MSNDNRLFSAMLIFSVLAAFNVCNSASWAGSRIQPAKRPVPSFERNSSGPKRICSAADFIIFRESPDAQEVRTVRLDDICPLTKKSFQAILIEHSSYTEPMLIALLYKAQDRDSGGPFVVVEARTWHAYTKTQKPDNLVFWSQLGPIKVHKSDYFTVQPSGERCESLYLGSEVETSPLLKCLLAGNRTAIGDYYRSLEPPQPASAIPWYRSALKRGKKRGILDLSVLSALSYALDEIGNSDGAIALLKEECDNRLTHRGRVQEMLARFYLDRMRDIPEALKGFLLAVDLLKVERGPLGNALAGLGECYRLTGNQAYTAIYLRKAIEALRAEGKPYGYQLCDLGAVYVDSKQYKVAIESLIKGIERLESEAGEDAESICKALYDLSEAYCGDRQYESALVTAKNALDRAKQENVELEGIWMHLAHLCQGFGNNGEAFAYCVQGIQAGDTDIDLVSHMLYLYEKFGITGGLSTKELEGYPQRFINMSKEEFERYRRSVQPEFFAVVEKAVEKLLNVYPLEEIVGFFEENLFDGGVT